MIPQWSLIDDLDTNMLMDTASILKSVGDTYRRLADAYETSVTLTDGELDSIIDCIELVKAYRRTLNRSV